MSRRSMAQLFKFSSVFQDGNWHSSLFGPLSDADTPQGTIEVLLIGSFIILAPALDHRTYDGGMPEDELSQLHEDRKTYKKSRSQLGHKYIGSFVANAESFDSGTDLLIHGASDLIQLVTTVDSCLAIPPPSCGHNCTIQASQ
ncbi:hypothetical protein DFH07DRAFT_960676 [Mycena maculata]|uniref:Uncharacterized protein n=1 Tax=Mycena maculata TaxID=230809 RepID=A0AAD7IY81_9AGAR|nr:hypothetical protein DFH07DRAFT_960676 [Mycena maculata]